jgi:hypothetical protein
MTPVTRLARFLAIYRPIYLGRDPWHWLTGMSMLSGRFWTAARGVHLLLNGSSSAVGASTGETISTIAGWSLPTSGSTAYSLAAVGRGGVQVTTPLTCAITFTAGVPQPLVPASPYGLNALAVVGGYIQVRWSETRKAVGTPAAWFNVYHDNGTGTMDWVTPVVATVTQLGCTLPAYADSVSVKIGVRAVSAASAEEANTTTVTCVARAAGAPATDAPSIEVISED